MPIISYMFLKVKEFKFKKIISNFYFFLKELRQCSLKYESLTSQHNCTTIMTLNSASGITSSSSSSMNHTEDEQIIDLQNRLQFEENIQVNQIFSFEISLLNSFSIQACYTNWPKSTCHFFECHFLTK